MITPRSGVSVDGDEVDGVGDGEVDGVGDGEVCHGHGCSRSKCHGQGCSRSRIEVTGNRQAVHAPVKGEGAG